MWPELELRTDLSDGDLGYLANLCHDCQDCYTACMYTAPHEFALNPPQVFAGLREDTYRRYAWPRRLPWRLAGWPGIAAALVAAAALLAAVSGRHRPALAGRRGQPGRAVPGRAVRPAPGACRRPGPVVRGGPGRGRRPLLA